jgi:hypothetical protein
MRTLTLLWYIALSISCDTDIMIDIEISRRDSLRCKYLRLFQFAEQHRATRNIVAVFSMTFCFGYLFGKILRNKSLANFGPFFICHASVDIVELMSE